jgi:HD-GYP domain-containing protein (c-di-GMP phosphodiesterase class II)
VTTRRLFISILVAQTGCIAVGLAFHYCYISSAVAQAAAEEARADLANQFNRLDGALERSSVASLQHAGPAWEQIVAVWRTTASPTDRLVLLDREGRAVTSADRRPTPNGTSQPLAIIHPNAAWGQFNEPIHGTLKDADGVENVALARSLASHDGYVLLTRLSAAERIDPVLLKSTLWVASGITLVWTIGSSAVAVFMLLAYFRQVPTVGRTHLDVQALRQAQALVRTQETVIFGLAKLSDSRDSDTGTHLERIAQFSSMLAAEMRHRPEFGDRISPSFVQLIGISSALHDIGKVGVEDSILRKPGSLTRDERERMQLHTQIGDECLREIERRLGSTNFLKMAREIVSAHHEWWDGQGYPLGLAGERIPLAARIVAVADVYDALRCKRVYKQALPHEECVRLIVEAAGSQFDPRVVQVFLQIHERFRQLADQFQNLEPPFPVAPSNDLNRLSTGEVEHVPFK